MKILLDMNLPPAWVNFLENQGFQAIHWSTLTLQKSRVLQIQGVKGAAVVIYRKPLTTQEMRCHRLSRRVNDMAAFH